jgi:hypothetical protein
VAVLIAATAHTFQMAADHPVGRQHAVGHTI